MYRLSLCLTALAFAAPSAPAAVSEPQAETRKGRVSETVRVDVDRLDHLMNLAGELVITKARFIAIARGLEELFHGSSAQADNGRIREAREHVKALSEAIHSLVNHMRNEQQMIRDWVDSQADQHREIRRLLEQFTRERVGK